MKRIQMTCGNCCGTGRDLMWEIITPGTAERRERKCMSCEGKGYTEHAVFSVEEAEAILKHCGLSVEGGD